MLRGLCALAGLAWAALPAYPAPLYPLAVRDGHCECVVAAEHADDQFLLIVSSLARGGGPVRVRCTADATADPEMVPLEQTTPDPAWRQRVRQLAERLARARRQPDMGQGHA